LSFEIWIFRNGQPDYDDERGIFIQQRSNVIWQSGQHEPCQYMT